MLLFKNSQLQRKFLDGNDLLFFPKREMIYRDLVPQYPGILQKS